MSSLAGMKETKGPNSDQLALWSGLLDEDVSVLVKTIGRMSNRLGPVSVKPFSMAGITAATDPFHEDGCSLLQFCILMGNIEKLRCFFKFLGKDIFDRKTKRLGWGALHFASYAGSIEVFTALKDLGCELNREGNDGLTPLHVCLMRGNRDLSLHMLGEGVKTEASSRTGNTVLHMCMHTPWSKGREDLRQGERCVIAQTLIAQGWMLGIQNNNGDTPLHLCLRNCLNEDVVSTLIKAQDVRTAITIVNKEGYTALHLAHTPGIVGILMQNGCASVRNLQGKDGKTALHMHCRENEVITQLLNNGVDPDIVDIKGRTALHIHLMRDYVNLEVVKTLFDAMGNIDIQDEHRNSVLHIACGQKYSNIDGRKTNDPLIEILIRGGSSINIQNSAGESALHLALRTKQYSKAAMLIRNGANVDLLDHQGASARNMDTPWINQILYEDPFDVRPYSTSSVESQEIAHNKFYCEEKSNVDSQQPVPLPSPNSMSSTLQRLQASPDIDELLADPNGIDELSLTLGLSKEDQSVPSTKNAEVLEREKALQTHLRRQITSLQEDMTSLQDVLEAYTMTPASPPSNSCHRGLDSRMSRASLAETRQSRLSVYDVEDQYDTLQKELDTMREVLEEVADDGMPLKS